MNRWRIARLVNRLPGRCWADLVSWTLRSPGSTLRSPQTSSCRADLDRNGTCYCGRLRTVSGKSAVR